MSFCGVSCGIPHIVCLHLAYVILRLVMRYSSHCVFAPSICHCGVCPAVAQSKDPVQRVPAPASLEIPAYELPSWSRSPQTRSLTSTTLQQLWLKCPDSFSKLLTPQHSHCLSSWHPTQTHASANTDSPGLTQPLSESLLQLTVQLQQHVQMLACGSTSSSVSMLHDLISFLRRCQGHMNRPESPAAATAAKEATTQVSSRQLPVGDSATSDSAADSVMAAAVHVCAVLVAHDEACQQAVRNSFMKEKLDTQVMLSSESFSCCLATSINRTALLTVSAFFFIFLS